MLKTFLRYSYKQRLSNRLLSRRGPWNARLIEVWPQLNGGRGITINLRQLRYYVKVVETGNITRASERLNIAQTALGQQIRHLEDSLGVQLLNRHSRGISLTKSGEVLYTHALAILASVEEAKREVMAHGAMRQETVNLGLTPSIQALIGPELVAIARHEIPDISFRVIEELSFILIDMLMRGELDLALAYESGMRPGLAATPLIEEELLLVAGTGSCHFGGSISFKEMLRTNLALLSDRDIVWRLIHEEAERQGLSVNVAFEVQSIPAIKALVARGAATSVVPYGAVGEEIRQGLITAYRIKQPSIRRTLFLNRRSDAAAFIHEDVLLGFLSGMTEKIAARMGPFGRVIGDSLPPGASPAKV
ncbi:hypothetical protein AVM02_09435 [Brucella anthropi]|uniref:LysR family transcriptional regulator n=1 Tax=Brucella anthropi TaxID=529 RepID=UPI0039884AC9